jgi:hypothetical protein
VVPIIRKTLFPGKSDVKTYPASPCYNRHWAALGTGGRQKSLLGKKMVGKWWAAAWILNAKNAQKRALTKLLRPSHDHRIDSC